jgi:hypothetical protein
MGFATETPRHRGGKLMKRKGEVASGEMSPDDPPTPGVLYGFETKRVAGEGICNRMKTKGEEEWVVDREKAMRS